MLQEMGCTSGQGYLFARPMPATQVRDLVRDNQEAIRLGIAAKSIRP